MQPAKYPLHPLRFILGILLFLVAAMLTTTSQAAAPKGFTESYAMVNGVRLHYMIGGKGPAVILLHGFGETSQMWVPLMPLLAKDHTVIVPDLRGAGQSARTESGYNKKNMATDIHELVRGLKIDKAQVVGHDIGLMVAYAYSAMFPSETTKLILMDAFIPGVGDWTKVWLLRDLWHFHFYGPTAEALVKGRERIYLEHFWNDFAADSKHSIPERMRQFYAKEYARDNGIRAGFQYFKMFEQDAGELGELAKKKLDIPVMVITGEKASGQVLIDQAKLAANSVDGHIIKGKGHWLMEEATDEVMPLIVDFLKP